VKARVEHTVNISCAECGHYLYFGIDTVQCLNKHCKYYAKRWNKPEFTLTPYTKDESYEPNQKKSRSKD
jgi:hypothetical protein